MSLLVERPVPVYDLSRIKPGDLVFARHYTWDAGKGGIITTATEDTLIAQFHPGIGNVTNHFIIPVAEARAGEWEIRWSADLVDVQEYSMTEQGGNDESGGTDL